MTSLLASLQQTGNQLAGFPAGLTVSAQGESTIAGNLNVTNVNSSGIITNNVTGGLFMTVFDETQAYAAVTQTPGASLLAPFSTKPTLSQQTGSLNFAAQNFSGSSSYSLKVVGYIKASATANYIFRATFNDGCRLWVGGVRLVESWAFRTSSAVVTAASLGMIQDMWTPIIVEHASTGASQQLLIEWSTNGTTFNTLTHTQGVGFQMAYDARESLSSSQVGTIYYNGKAFFRDYAIFPNSSTFTGRVSELAGDTLSLAGNLVSNGVIVGNGALVSNLNASSIVTGTLANARLPSAISVTSVAGDGSALTSLNATNVTSGTLTNARLPSAISVTSVAGDGSALTALNATNITTGTLNNSFLPSAISVTSVAGDGSALTSLNATNVTTGTLANARLPSAISVTSVTGSGSGLTALNATNIASGTLNNAFLPSAISVTSVAGSGSGLTALNATNITTGTLNNSRLPSTISVSSVVATFITLNGGSLTNNAPTAWIPVSFQNSWVNYDATLWVSAAYMLDPYLQRVFIRGMVKNGSSAGAIIFTLPVGYRPPFGAQFVVWPGGFGINVASNGAVNLINGSTGLVCLDQISFTVYN